MTAVTPDPNWVPGDPYMPDHGHGPGANVTMTPEQRDQVIAEGGTPPPWWRPPTEGPTPGSWTRSCTTCGVCWSGDTPCWMCGGEESP